MNIAFPAGLLLALAPWLLPTPEGLDPHAWHALGIMLAMALWWLTEIIPLAATALVPLAIFPLIGASSFATTASSYANPLIMLFLGGFMIARAVEKWGLHIRVSSWIMGFAGRSPAGIVGGLMVATAFLSLWISNTASAMIMVPVAAAAARGHDDRFAAAALLGVAYAATIGGLGSLIGTPPNALFAAYMEEAHGITIADKQVLSIKNLYKHTDDFAPLVRKQLYVASPGTSNADWNALPFKRLPRPMWPFDADPLGRDGMA